MKTLILAVLLAVTQAPSPVTQETAHKTADGRQDVNQQSSTQQSPATKATAAQNPYSANSDESKSGKPASGNAQETLFISESAAVPGKDAWDKASVIFNALLVIIGGLGVGAAIKTLRAIERQAKANEDTLTEIKSAAKQTDRMIQHAETQARIAQASLELSRDTAKKQLRPYIALKEPRLFLHDDGAVEFALELKNSGQTPAYELEGACLCRFESYPVKSPGDPPAKIRKSRSIIGAGGTFFVLPDVVPSKSNSIQSLLAGLSSPTFVCCVNGYYTYRDIFKDSHFIRFQLITGGPAGLRHDTDKNGKLFLVLGNDSEGNEAD